MLSAYDQQDALVTAWEVTKAQGPFCCPECEEQVIVKNGTHKTHHFAHQPDSICTYGTGESEQHRQAKYRIYEALRQHHDVTKLAVERPLGEVRPDISFCWQGKDYVAIELQISTISPEEIERRTCIYAEKKIAILWTIPYREHMTCLTPYRTLLWERYLHALYFGVVFYWLAGEELYPVHFEPTTDYKLVRNGEEGKLSIKKVEQFSSAFRNVVPGDIVRITELQQVWRPARQVGKFSLPRARLWSFSRIENRVD